MTFETPFFLPYDRQNFRFRKLTEICQRRMNMQGLVRKGHRAYRVVSHVPFCGSISGYWSALYAETLSTWRLCSFQAQTRRGVVTEYLWCNYPAPTALHDYRYLGKDFRERERIKRMTARWVNRLQAMPILQRQALQAALAQVDNGVGLYRQGWR
jgi:hypothetical protein